MQLFKYFITGLVVFVGSSSVNAQSVENGFYPTGIFSLSFSNTGYPFANLLVEDTLNSIPNETIDSLLNHINSNVNELYKTPLSKASKWQLTSMSCHSQQGMMNQNQAFISESNYVSNHSVSFITGAELINEFSKDTLIKVDLSAQHLFDSEVPKDGVWDFIQCGDVLLVKMSRNLANSTGNGNNLIPNQFYHWEEYWYFFKQL